MKKFISLKIFDKFRFLYEKLGVDYETMRLILSVKLTIDSRKTSNLLTNTNFNESSNQYKIMQIIYAILGFFMMIFMIISKNTFISMAIYFSMFMFLMLTTFISDFSSVILDVKDKGILAIRGVSLKTINASKVTHIMIYVINTSITLSGFSLIVSLKYGLIFSLVFLVEILIIDIFMIIVSALVYLVILKIFDGEKLKDTITIIQIGFTMLFSFGYIFVMNISESMNLLSNIDLGVVNYFLPPFWFSAPLEIIATKNINKSLMILSFLALVIPLISVLIYTKLIPVFEKNLQKLNNEGSNKRVIKHNLTMRLSKIVCRDKEERIFFNFISNIIRKDRDFKAIVYTTIGSNLVFMFFNFDRYLKDLNSYIYFNLYCYTILIPTIIIALKRSRNYKASYIYTTMPIKNKMHVHKGAIKACLVNIIIPLYLIQSVIFVYFSNLDIIRHIVVIFLVNIFITINTFKILNKSMPFSLQINVIKRKDSILENYLMGALTIIMAGIHFITSVFGTVVVNIYIIFIFIVNILMYKSAFKIK
ncbi:hypothetical protein [Paraclostridium sordellii]|uniref:hypothetical protein n=1 Tax=Paraclostridium sordellii TaxID=1505 RepID=UPI0005E2D8C7|nr:hypothetical protein [Paeniclostridium sordellii]CEO13605.1 ABC transporter permease [[Clostridium] sordellii] [Paeniclostridium sordellii]CEP88929.1 ABC transporter permease [[Clostridium] sordellii] [Paeniclostridium sordellii]CEP97948.1 ABC transporter permease [[Clostridium] sordellii] [Paeniclostridium sordellii]CEQ01336.1 ABC transporter permease [[Clostridium] sordellii] [Paeniclostridium sordellii]